MDTAQPIDVPKQLSTKLQKTSQLKLHIKAALAKAKLREDPWKDFDIEKTETKIALRHRYSAVKTKWTTDTVLVKMETKEFARGAMRQCFRLKKLSTIHTEDWHQASNYMAKKYIESGVPTSIYYEDVRLQADAKLWGERFNRANPPKKIDIFQMYVIEVDGQCYHLEHFIEGNYMKYNSNSGFVEDRISRATPHAFSHFTFEQSGHELIVVDIQGVGDLYTDPQIHTSDGLDYGDGNLGAKGMALFFHSHECNPVCRLLGLSVFDLSPRELGSRLSRPKLPSCTIVRSRSTSFTSDEPTSPPSSSEHCAENAFFRTNIPKRAHHDSESSDIDFSPGSFPRRSHHDSECSEPDTREFIRRPSCVAQFTFDGHANEVLGRVHLEFARYYELGRFSGENESIDMESALFHLEVGADLGYLEAMKALAQIHLQLDNDVLQSAQVPNTEENINKGIIYMEKCASRNDRDAVIFMAKAFDSGYNLGTVRRRDWLRSVDLYARAVELAQNSDISNDYSACLDDPTYRLIGRQGEMYLKGGYGLDPDPSFAGDLFSEAADLAMASFKGQAAAKYFTLAEEAWALIEE